MPQSIKYYIAIYFNDCLNLMNCDMLIYSVVVKKYVKLLVM